MLLAKKEPTLVGEWKVTVQQKHMAAVQSFKNMEG